MFSCNKTHCNVFLVLLMTKCTTIVSYFDCNAENISIKYLKFALINATTNVSLFLQ